MNDHRSSRLSVVVASVLLAAGCSDGRPSTDRFTADLQPPGPVADGPMPAQPDSALKARQAAVVVPPTATPATAEAWSPGMHNAADPTTITAVHVLRPDHPPISAYRTAQYAVLERVYAQDRQGRWYLTPPLNRPAHDLAEQFLDPGKLTLDCNAGRMDSAGNLTVEGPDPVQVANEGFHVTVSVAGGPTTTAFIIPPAFDDLKTLDLSPPDQPQTSAGRPGRPGQAGNQGEHGGNGDSGRSGSNGNIGGDGGDGSSGRSGGNGRRGGDGKRADDGEPGKPGQRGIDALPATVEVAPQPSPHVRKPLLVVNVTIDKTQKHWVIPAETALVLLARGGKGGKGADGGAGGAGGRGGGGGNGGNGGSGGNGGNGGNGQQGQRGANGGTGQAGSPGGPGGRGGNGGNGGDAGTGGDSGDGGNAGDGGRGGNAGNGGDGGDGPVLHLIASDEAVAAALRTWQVDVRGGDGGEPGTPGAGGTAGEGGHAGKIGQPGQPGSGGSAGAGGAGGKGGAGGPVQVQVSNDNGLAGIFANALASASVQAMMSGSDGPDGQAGSPGASGHSADGGRAGQAGATGRAGDAGEPAKAGKAGKLGQADLPAGAGTTSPAAQ